MKHRIAQLAIVGTIALLLAAAQVPGLAKSPAKKPAEAPLALSADEAVAEARRAFVRNDAARFEAAARLVDPDHLLAKYIDFWRLRMDLRRQEASPVPSASAADRQVRRFLAEHEGTVVADLMRRDWLMDLGKRRNWEPFDAEYAAWVLRDDDQVHCYHWLGRVERKLSADGALAAIDEPRHLRDGCGDLLDAMHETGRIDRERVRQRMLAALEVDSRDSVERTATLLGLNADAIGNAWSRPLAALAKSSGREHTLIAIARYARSNPQEAARWLEEGRAALKGPDLAFAWSQVAAAGMRRLAPESFEWTRRALDARVGDETLAWMARAALREQHWPTLRAIVARMSQEGRDDPAWAYWEGRALLAAGDGEGGRERLSKVAGGFHFYGQLAAEELGELVRTPPRAQRASEAEIAAAAANPGFARALRFYEIGLRLEGNREWNYQLRSMNDRQLLAAAEFACRQRVLDRCVNTADLTRAEHDFSLRFVTPFIDELKPVAAERELDPAWIYGLIRQESRFIMDARSSAGAQGLMQIMPATGRWIAGKLGVDRFQVSQLNELQTNLEFGTYYLRTVLDKLDGSPVLASAAYNAGPRRPLNWRATLPGPVEGAIFAEIIPFSETRDYVKKVLSNAVIYAELFSGQPQSLKARLGTITPQPATQSEVP